MPTLSRLLAHHAQYRSGYPGFIFEGQVWTFAELNRDVNQLANALLSQGLTKGDRFATILPNCPELMFSYWAAAVSGLVIVPCSNLLQRSGLNTLISNSGASFVFTNSDKSKDVANLIEKQKQLSKDCVVICDQASSPQYQSYRQFVLDHSSESPEIPVHPEDMYNIMYSSGTTGQPKGIVHTHRIRSMYCTLFANAWRMTPESVVLHAGAIVFNGAMLDLMPWMMLGCQYILHQNFDPERVIQEIEQSRVSHIVLVPAQIIAILNHPSFVPSKLKSLEMIHNVGAPLHLEYKHRINKELPGRYYELYGVTEGFMTILDKTEATTKPASVGKPAAFNEVVILDSDGNSCATGEVGEICGDGPLVMSEYFGQPQLTQDTFHGRWLRSGDLGYLDEDGYVFLIDRKKDMIISGGVNVYPRDIEEVIVAHPAVAEVAVFGVNDAKWGEVPVAAVTLKSTEINSTTAEQLLVWTNQRVAAKFQRLKSVELLQDFPRNVAGKILKRQLASQYNS